MSLACGHKPKHWTHSLTKGKMRGSQHSQFNLKGKWWSRIHHLRSCICLCEILVIQLVRLTDLQCHHNCFFFASSMNKTTTSSVCVWYLRINTLHICLTNQRQTTATLTTVRPLNIQTPSPQYLQITRRQGREPAVSVNCHLQSFPEAHILHLNPKLRNASKHWRGGCS